jgi:hypothetical protein
MKTTLTIQPTDEIVILQGARCRLWIGSASDRPLSKIAVFVAAVGVRDAASAEACAALEPVLTLGDERNAAEAAMRRALSTCIDPRHIL